MDVAATNAAGWMLWARTGGGQTKVSLYITGRYHPVKGCRLRAREPGRTHAIAPRAAVDQIEVETQMCDALFAWGRKKAEE